MEKINGSAAYTLVKAALESKAITLGGPTCASTPAESGAKDAQYLLALIKHLSEPVKP